MTLREYIHGLGFEQMTNEGNIYWRIADKNPVLDKFIYVNGRESEN